GGNDRGAAGDGVWKQPRRSLPLPQRASNGQGGVRMLRSGVTANTTDSVSGIKGEGETRPRKTGKLLRILVVEDNRDAADSLRLLLEFSGHEVAVAYSGHDGVQAAERYQPDVVLCDIGLPGLDGYGVARKLRESPTTAKARLIAVTAYGRDEDRRRSHEAGFEQHLVKPVDPDALQRELNCSAALKRSSGFAPPGREGRRKGPTAKVRGSFASCPPAARRRTISGGKPRKARSLAAGWRANTAVASAAPRLGGRRQDFGPPGAVRERW